MGVFQIQIKMIDYTRFRWFFTSSGALVIGGKSAESNEEAIRLAKKDSIVMHTEQPGSPFCLIIDEDANEKDLEETAVFCASLSKAWKAGKKSAEVHIFAGSQVYKAKGMKKGTFGVEGRAKSLKAELKLYLAFQEGKLRAVPFKTELAELTPGSMKKEQAAEEIAKKLKVKKEEALSALPSDNMEIKWY